MKKVIASFAICLLAFNSAFAQKKESTTEVDDSAVIDISGTYKVLSGKRAGEDIGEDRLPPEIKVSDDAFTIPSPGATFVMSYQIDSTASPMAIDMKIKEGAPESPGLGIVKMEGNKLTLCYDPMGQERPDSFESTEDNGAFLFVMEKSGAKFDPEKIVGDWQCIMGERAGEEVPEERMASVISISKDKITIPLGPDMAFVMGYEVDASKSPAAVDMKILEGPGEGNAVGIMKMEDGKLFLCYDPTGENRPEEFKTDADNGFFMFKMEASVD